MYKHKSEIVKLTLNFFNKFKLKNPLNSNYNYKISQTVLVPTALDINVLMNYTPNAIRLWNSHFFIPPWQYFTLQKKAEKIQKIYQGLIDYNQKQVQRCKQREDKIYKKLMHKSSSSMVEDRLDNS